MILAIVLGSMLAQPAPRIGFEDAASAALWFCRCVDMRPAPRVTGVFYSENPNDHTYGGVARYHIEAVSGARDPYDIQVDAVSGRVLFVSNLHDGPRFVAPAKSESDRWIRRLGVARDLVYDPQLARYNLMVGHVPMCNLNGDSQAGFLIQSGELAWYLSPALPPPAPEGVISVPAAPAEALAVAERKKSVPHWPQELSTKATPAIFYDDDSKQTRWAWRVAEGASLNGKFNESWIHYVDAESGALISSDRIMSSLWRYRSGPPRSGLVGVPKTNPLEGQLGPLERKLRELGRAGSELERVRFGTAVQADLKGFHQLVMKPNGDLQSFQGDYTPGRMADGAALAFGKKLILAQHPPLGEGEFRLENAPGRGNSGVVFVQRAFGYPYFDSILAAVDFDSSGVVCSFRLKQPAPRPTALPSTILGSEHIEALALVQARAWKLPPALQASGIRSVKAMDAGWHVGPAGVRLVYRVQILFTPANRPSGVIDAGKSMNMVMAWVRMFDAETGQCLDPPN